VTIIRCESVMIEMKRLLRGREKLLVLLGTRQNFFWLRPQWFAQGEMAKGLFRPRMRPLGALFAPFPHQKVSYAMPIHLTWQAESSLKMEAKLWACRKLDVAQKKQEY
jgi:hypothetical protein